MTVDRQRCFIIEGNIGAGKSTLVNLIKKRLGLDVVLEPHERWQNIGGTQKNILDHFYKQPARWAYTFQTYAFVTRIMAQKEQGQRSGTRLQILERSVFSDRYCFAYNAYESGIMNTLEWQMYQEWFDWFVGSYVPVPHGFIYLQVDPSVCYHRVRLRARSEEMELSPEYLQQLHEKHEGWLIQKQFIAPSLVNIPVLVLSANTDFASNRGQQDLFLAKIAQFIDLSDERILQKELSSVVSLEKAL